MARTIWARPSDWCDELMPTYDLTCKECGHRFERFLTRLLRDTDKVCPKCSSVQVVAGVGGGFFARTVESSVGCSSTGGFG